MQCHSVLNKTVYKANSEGVTEIYISFFFIFNFLMAGWAYISIMLLPIPFHSYCRLYCIQTSSIVLCVMVEENNTTIITKNTNIVLQGRLKL